MRLLVHIAPQNPARVLAYPAGAVALASSSQRARGAVSMVSTSPSASRSAPAQAIIAPLSVHSAGGGTISVVPAFAATSCSAPRIA